MAGTASIRIMACLLLGTGSALCQQPNKVNSLPDAPSVQSANQTETPRSLIGMIGHHVTKLGLANGDSDPKLAPKYDPLHFESETKFSHEKATSPEAWTPTLLYRKTAFHESLSASLVGRATDAALSVIVPRDECGQRKLNTPYLLRVLTMATAHVAERPYWRRSIGQPFSDFGSTVGNDAGMSVLREFRPGLLELVKGHEPKFVSRIEKRAH